MNRQPLTAERAIERLEQLCARSEHCTGEIAEKLRQWQISATDAERIIEHLVRHRFVDDRRYARAYVNDKVNFAHWGRRKVQQGLWRKKVDSAIAAEALCEIDAEEYENNLRRLIRQKAKSAPELLESYEGRTKIYRHILSRGYEPDLAGRVLRQELTAMLDGGRHHGADPADQA